MTSVTARVAGREENAVAGRLFMARMGRTTRETQVACAKKATANLGGEVLIFSKRESSPVERMRVKR